MECIGEARTACFAGPRPKNYPWGSNKECEAKIAEKVKVAVQSAIEKGYRHFISGMAAGIDLLAAKIVLQLSEDMPEKGITLEAAIPFPDQPRRWKEQTKREYAILLSRCDSVRIIADAFSVAAYRERDEYMLGRSSLLIAVAGKRDSGTARTIAYAQKLDREIVLLHIHE